MERLQATELQRYNSFSHFKGKSVDKENLGQNISLRANSLPDIEALTAQLAGLKLRGYPARSEQKEEVGKVSAAQEGPKTDANLVILERACHALGYPRGIAGGLKKHFSGIQIHKQLGEGSLSLVFLVTFPGNKKPVALKLCRYHTDPDCRTTGYSKEREGGELLSTTLNSPFLVKTHGVFALNSERKLEWIQDPAKRSTDKGTILAVVQDYVPQAQELFDYIAEGKIETPEQMYQVAASIACGLYHLHKHFNMPHRDVKPENVLVGSTGIKLIDFSFLTRKERTKTQCGSPAYLAPEVVIADEKDYDGKLVDAFSFATLLFVMRFGESPWFTVDEEDMGIHLDLLRSFYESDRGSTLADYFPKDEKPINEQDEQFLDLIRKLGVGKPEQRMSVVEAVETHPYFAPLREKPSTE